MAISFGGTEDPVAYGESITIGGLNPNVNKKLSAAIASILETRLSVAKSWFFLKFFDTRVSGTHLNDYAYASSLSTTQLCLLAPRWGFHIPKLNMQSCRYLLGILCQISKPGFRCENESTC